MALTLAKAWESVIVRAGGALRPSRARCRPSGWQQTGMQPRSRHHEDDDVVLADEAAGEEAGLFVGARGLEPLQQTGLVIGFSPGADFHHGDLGCFQQLEPAVVFGVAGAEEDGDVGGVDGGAAAAFALGAQGAGVAVAGRIDQNAGTQSRKLDGFPDRVRGRAGQFAHQRDFLSRQGVHQRGFAAVRRPEESDLQPVHPRIGNLFRRFRCASAARWRSRGCGLRECP